MWSILPYDIIAEIIATVGEDKDTELLKELSLVSHSLHQICCKYLFATVNLHDAKPIGRLSSKKGFVKLLKSRPDVVKYIRKLTYEVNHWYSYYNINNDDHMLSPTLPNFLRTISRLNCLTIDCSRVKWDELDSSLTSAFLYLMHLPTINHIDLSHIENFPLSTLTPSINLLRLDIRNVKPLEKEVVVQSEMMPKIREFHTSASVLLTTKLLHAKLLEELHVLSVKCHQTLEGRRLHDIFSASAGTLKVLELSVDLVEYHDGTINLPFEDLCEELEAMAGHNMLEVLSFEVKLFRNVTADDIGSMIQSLEKVLVKPGWSGLRQVSFKVPVVCCAVNRCAELAEKLQSLLPDKYLSHLSKLESVALSVSSYVFRKRFHVH
jgi:hypothetical protein